MKLNRTREEWAKWPPYTTGYSYSDATKALKDLATLFAEVERLRGALQWIERRGSPQALADRPSRLSEVMAYVARKALGNTHD
jgi:hypothetical protein